MTKRLALFEFISFREAKDFYALVSDLAKGIKELKEGIEHRLSRENIDAYAPEGVRARLRRSASEESKTLETLLQQKAPLEKVSPILNHLENLYYILKQFKAETATCDEIKAVLDLAKSIYPGFSEEDKEEAYGDAALANARTPQASQISTVKDVLPVSEPSLASRLKARRNYLDMMDV